MGRVQTSGVMWATVMAGLVFCLTLTMWKMFQFHGRLRAIENPQWEQRLANEHLYGRPIVFFGDSQITNWPMATSFGALPVLDRGSGGDLATEAPSRFAREVLPLKPALVVILIGTNDLAHGRSADSILRSIEQMTVSARKQNAAVILCSLLPARGEFAHVRPRQQIELINSGLRALAATQGADYIDLYSELVNDRGEFGETFSDDGLHPNAAGYLRMTKALLPQLLQSYLALVSPTGADTAAAPSATR